MKNLNEIINKKLEDRLEELDESLIYEEYMFEMATIRKASRDDNMMMAINPDRDRIGDPYFKVYNNGFWKKATKVARLAFKEPKLINHHNGAIKPWENLSKKDIAYIEDYLDSPSSYQGITVWDELKYRWNVEYGFYIGSINDYFRGEFDEEYKDEPSYVPSYLEPPDYRKLII